MSASKFSLKPRELSETETTLQILDYLFFKKIKAWRQNNIGVYDQKKGIYRKPGRHRKKGLFDISGLVPSGHRLEIEVKLPAELAYIIKHYEMLSTYRGPDKRKNHYREQIEFQKLIIGSGGHAFFVCSLQGVIDYFEDIQGKR